MTRPEYKYAINRAGLNLSYCTLGDGPNTILWVPNFVGRVDVLWLNPSMNRFLGRLATVGRLVAFDMAGMGGSDPIAPDELPTMEQWMDDVRVILDAESIERVTLICMDSAAAPGALFAATHPDRVSGMVLFGSFARLERDDDYPLGIPRELRERAVDGWMRVWGTGKQLTITSPSLANDEITREWSAFIERASGPRRLWRPIFEMIAQIDIRDVLPAIRVPTLVMHRTDDHWVNVELGRWLAQHIPGARFAELPGDDHYPFFGDSEAVLREIRAFVSGEHDVAGAEDRALATLLFTDIVDSTARAADLGDSQWRVLLDRHDDGVRAALGRFRGREVKTMGDGFLATFDGPARAVRCALEITDLARAIGLQVRAGLHTGEIEIRGEDVAGIAVALAARVAASAGPGEVLTSQTVKDLTIGSGLAFDDRGAYALKGLPGEWRLYAVTP